MSSQLRQAVALAAAVLIAGLCLALATAAAPGTTHARPGSAQARYGRALQGNIRKLESEGYVPRSCTTSGLLMFNPRTGRLATVRY